MKDNIIYATLRYLYHRVTKKRSWRIFWITPSWNTFGNNEGWWIVSPRLTRREARSYTSGGFWSHIHFDPGPDDLYTKLPEYTKDQRPNDDVHDIAHYHYKYKSTLWGK
jgi:hypothetical protein